MRRNSIIKYLCQQIDQERTLNQCSKKLMNSQLGEFSMVYFDQFVEVYKATNTLVLEALAAFDHFIPALNDFLDMFEDSQKKQLTISRFIDTVILMLQTETIFTPKASIIISQLLAMLQLIWMSKMLKTIIQMMVHVSEKYVVLRIAQLT